MKRKQMSPKAFTDFIAEYLRSAGWENQKDLSLEEAVADALENFGMQITAWGEKESEPGKPS